MRFDFKLFSAITAKAYKMLERPIYSPAYTLEEVLTVFWYYFDKYEQVRRQPHPPIRMEQVQRIIEAMPYVDSSSYTGSVRDIDPEHYKTMIDRHFKTRYRFCDYNINHFFSGDIRLLRFYEELYCKEDIVNRNILQIIPPPVNLFLITNFDDMDTEFSCERVLCLALVENEDGSREVIPMANDDSGERIIAPDSMDNRYIEFR